MTARILGDYGIYGGNLAGIAGPVIGSYNNLQSIGLVGSTNAKEPTSVLQFIGHQAVWANGSRGNTSYENLRAGDGLYIPHMPPDHHNMRGATQVDEPYFEFLKDFFGN